jgi:hypothetical protein
MLWTAAITGCRIDAVGALNGRVVAFAGTWDAAAIAPWLDALEGERRSG